MTVTEAEEHLLRFIEVDQAWKVLSNQETKRAYDLQLRGKSSSFHSLEESLRGTLQSGSVKKHSLSHNVHYIYTSTLYSHSLMLFQPPSHPSHSFFFNSSPVIHLNMKHDFSFHYTFGILWFYLFLLVGSCSIKFHSNSPWDHPLLNIE